MKRYFSLIITLLATMSAMVHPLATPSLSTDNIVPVSAEAPVVIFDLNGVLFDTDVITVLRQLGLKDVLLYLARHRQSPRAIKNRFYETLHRIAPLELNKIALKDTDGAVMPQLMVDWLRGTHPNKLLLERITIAINANPSWFSSTIEQRLITAMAHAIFNPEHFVASRKLLVDLAPLIIRLKTHYNAKLYILSNWDKESFSLLKHRYPHVFMWFDGHIISGEVGHVKPEKEIYTHTHQKAAVTHICFLDDQQENIDASHHHCKWHPVLVNKMATYFGRSSTIDTDTITKQVFQFLEQQQKYHEASLPKPLELPLEQSHATP